MHYYFKDIGYELHNTFGDTFTPPTIMAEVEITPTTAKEWCAINAAISSRSYREMSELAALFNSRPTLPNIKNVYFNKPVTVVLWDDGTKTIVRCQDGDTYSRETGLALCVAKKAMGNKSNFNDIFHKWIPEGKKEKPKEKKYNADDWNVACRTCAHSDDEDNYACFWCDLDYSNWEHK